MRDTFLTEMGIRIYTARKNLHLSQEELAERADLSKQTVSRAENGQRELGAGNIMKVAGALGVSTDYLLTGRYTGADARMLDQKLACLTPRQFAYLEDFVNKFVEMCDEGTI